METFHTIFCIQFIYTYLIHHFGDLPFIGVIYWSGGITVLLGILIALAVHSFYVRRVWILSNGSIPVTGIIAFFAICRFGFGIATSILSYTINSWAIFRERKLPLMTLSVGLGSAALVDILAALALSFYLKRGRSGMQQSDSRINLLMLYTVNTGTLTSIVSILTVILFVAQPKSLAFLGLVEIQSKLYANSFLASLNARRHIRAKFNTTQFTSVELAQSKPPQFRSTSRPLEVYQQTVIDRDNDVRSVSDADTTHKLKQDLV